MPTRRKRNKYGAKAAWYCENCDISYATALTCRGCGEAPTRFDSTGERNRHAELVLLEKAGEISWLRRQVSFPIVIHAGPDRLPGAETPPHTTTVGHYVADWTYLEREKLVVEDFKGVDTPLSKFKRACVEASRGVTIRLSH